MTGSGKTAAFLLPILHQLIDKPRGTTRALMLTPTRELAAQILEDLNDLAVHTPITGAASSAASAWARRSTPSAAASTCIVATPGPAARPLPRALREARRARVPRARRGGPDARHGLPARHPPRAAAPARRGGRRCSSAPRCRRRSSTLAREMLHNPVTINLERQAGAGGRDHPGGLPGAAGAQGGAASWRCCKRGEMQEALVFTRTKHRANRLAGIPGQARDQGRADPRQPLAGAADRGARGLQGRPLPRARRHRHRGARHRRRGARPRRQLRRAGRAGGLHPPRRPHRARRADRRRVHVRVAGGGGRPARHRARHRPAAAARHRARLRLHGAAGDEARDPARRAHRGDPRQEGGGPGARQGKGGAARGARQASSARPASRRGPAGQRRRAPARAWSGGRPGGGRTGAAADGRAGVAGPADGPRLAEGAEVEAEPRSARHPEQREGGMPRGMPPSRRQGDSGARPCSRPTAPPSSAASPASSRWPCCMRPPRRPRPSSRRSGRRSRARPCS